MQSAFDTHQLRATTFSVKIRDPQLSADSVSVYAERGLEAHRDDDQPWFLDARDLLFDLALDPTERCDRSGDPAYADICRDLTARLDHWMRRSEDALLDGLTPSPAAPSTADGREMAGTPPSPCSG